MFSFVCLFSISQKVTNLKIQSNPFARGFRGDWRKTKAKRSTNKSKEDGANINNGMTGGSLGTSTSFGDGGTGCDDSEEMTADDSYGAAIMNSADYDYDDDEDETNSDVDGQLAQNNHHGNRHSHHSNSGGLSTSFASYDESKENVNNTSSMNSFVDSHGDLIGGDETVTIKVEPDY